MSGKPTSNQGIHQSDSGSPLPGEPEFLAVGKLRRPHGLNGEMLMMVWTDFPERLQPGKQVYVGNSYQPYIVKKIRGHGNSSLISFQDLGNREDVAELRNHVVFVKTLDIPDLPENEIYLHQLLGMRVISDRDNIFLGNVTEILETGANHVLVVKKDDKPDILLPDIKSVILKIDVKNREITAHLIPGLMPDDL